MSDDYSLGSALDLAGRSKDLAESVNRGAQQAAGDVKQHIPNMAKKQADKIKASHSKIEAARSGIEVRMAETERNFSMLKRGLSMAQAIVGGVVSGVSDRKTNIDRAHVAVQNGAAAQRRLSAGGQHQQDMNGILDFDKQRQGLQQQMDDNRSAMAELQNKYQGGGAWSSADSKQYADLRKAQQTMEQMAGELSVMSSFKVNTGAMTDMTIPGQNQRGSNGTDFSFQADPQAYLQQIGMNDRQIEAVNNYNKLQTDLLGDSSKVQAQAEKRADDLGLQGQDRQHFIDEAVKNNAPILDRLQDKLTEIGNDQHAMRKFGAAAGYVNAKADLDRLEKTPGADPSDLSAARQNVRKSESEFNRAENDADPDRWKKGPWGQMINQLVQEALGALGELDGVQGLNRRYADAIAAMSRAADEAGQAAKQANDMELS